MIAGGRRELWLDEVSARARPRDLWLQVAVISLTLALLDGYGAYDQLFPVTPMKYVLVQLPLLTTTFILCPRGSMNRVFLPLASVLFVGWWIASYLWDANRAGWISASLRDLTTVVAIVVLSQLLGTAEFIRVLLRSGYIAIGLILVALLVQPGLAYSVGGPAPGLHGGFVHKNAMAPCLLVTAAIVLCFQNRIFVKSLNFGPATAAKRGWSKAISARSASPAGPSVISNEGSPAMAASESTRPGDLQT